jgi:phosphohistidine phosphatase
MSKTLLLMRHAKSSWKDKELKDFDRPLKKRGLEAAKLVGKTLVITDSLPDAVLTSPAKRASEAADLVIENSGYQGTTEYFDSFYMGEPEDYINVLRELPDELDRVLVIGHNPGLEALLQVLEGKVNALPTGAVAFLELELKHWRDLNPSTVGELVNFWDPDEMDLEEIEEKMAKDKKDKEKKVEKKEEQKDKKVKKEKKEKKEKKGKK